MVEILVLIEPLYAEVVLTRVLQALVHGIKVLRATHFGDPSMGWVIDRVVEETEAGRVPPLTNLGVKVNRAVEVSIDLLKDSRVDLVIVVLQSVMEDHLEVGVVTEVLREVLG